MENWYFFKKYERLKIVNNEENFKENVKKIGDFNGRMGEMIKIWKENVEKNWYFNGKNLKNIEKLEILVKKWWKFGKLERKRGKKLVILMKNEKNLEIYMPVFCRGTIVNINFVVHKSIQIWN